ncbi:MAG: flagellar biosynthesis protein FliQ [Helicobacteraceae bacterium]|jgi:flagellar biosynthetic protein FliQ|nr:flagellar biosynthesis protein FliQ [Helicobacteraceae bacterium]
MEGQLVALASDTFKIALMIAAPMLIGGLVAGLLISVFQATTQINEMTLSFVPKILVVAAIMILSMPWMMNMMIDFTIRTFELIPIFPSNG